MGPSIETNASWTKNKKEGQEVFDARTGAKYTLCPARKPVHYCESKEEAIVMLQVVYATKRPI
jgi:hypothetical protein